MFWLNFFVKSCKSKFLTRSLGVVFVYGSYDHTHLVRPVVKVTRDTLLNGSVGLQMILQEFTVKKTANKSCSTGNTSMSKFKARLLILVTCYKYYN